MNKIVTLSSANEVLSHINNLSAEPTVFIDVDDTIITPKSYSFRSPPYNKLIDKIKANHDKYDNYEEIISNWRLQRKIILIDEQWSDVINKLKEKYKVFALTAMDMGPIGNIASMEQWRYNELSSYGINFTQNISFKNQDKANECFYKGIFMTGTKSKSKTIEPFLSELSTKTLVMVDDRKSHIDDIGSLCKRYNINYLGIIFTGLSNVPGAPVPKIAKIQEEYLIKYSRWLEDDEASSLLP